MLIEISFVCACASETKGSKRLRSYSIPGQIDLEVQPTITQAALATSAAISFFDPVKIGARTFVDGGLGTNNPVDQVEAEAIDIWCRDTGNLKPLVKCFISIGTGDPGKSPIEEKAWKFLSKTLVEIATDTETKAQQFASRCRDLLIGGQYFRFNVLQGLQNIGLHEYKKEGPLETATFEYLRQAEEDIKLRACVEKLKDRQSVRI